MAKAATNEVTHSLSILKPRNAASQGAPQFLQTVIDAFPDSMVVIDRDYRVVLANRAAKAMAGCDPVSSCLHCFEVSHHRDNRCDDGGKQCPLQLVADSKVPVTVVHAHTCADGQEIYFEITAAPIFDEHGEVRLVVESCRDISDRKRAARFLEVANRQVAMKPLLEEFTAELKAFSRCSVAHIRLVDQSGNLSRCVFDEGAATSPERNGHPCGHERCPCMWVIKGQTDATRPYCTEGGSLYSGCANLAARELSGLCDRTGYRSCALVPVRIGSRIVGLIHVADPHEGVVTRPMVEALERVALELGTAIQRVESDEALRAAHDLLEARVEQRTAELTRTNRALQAEIMERSRLEREILQISEQEQQRIGQELHDGLGQELTGLSYLAASLQQKLRGHGLAEADLAAELAQGIPRVVSQLRRIVRGLIPLEINAADLQSALGALADSIEEQANISCRFDSDRLAQVQDDQMALQVYRIAQEAVANSLKHGRATEIVLGLRATLSHIELTVRDNGPGISDNAENAAGCGLRIMRHRAQVIGGTLQVRRSGALGTVVTCVFPRK
jgi:PAS domain S-box-containing protein